MFLLQKEESDSDFCFRIFSVPAFTDKGLLRRLRGGRPRDGGRPIAV